VSSYVGLTPGVVLEIKFKGKRRMELPQRKWISQLLEDKAREELSKNKK
jgi:hypothetical protein